MSIADALWTPAAPFFIIILGTACVCVARMSHTAVDLFQDIDFLFYISHFVYLFIRATVPPAFSLYEAITLFSQTWDEWILYLPLNFGLECAMLFNFWTSSIYDSEMSQWPERSGLFFFPSQCLKNWMMGNSQHFRVWTSYFSRWIGITEIIWYVTQLSFPHLLLTAKIRVSLIMLLTAAQREIFQSVFSFCFVPTNLLDMYRTRSHRYMLCCSQDR